MPNNRQMKQPLKILDITEAKSIEIGKIYTYKGVLVPCPECDKCLIVKLEYECKFKKL